jgi:hypothetical protein
MDVQAGSIGVDGYSERELGEEERRVEVRRYNFF